MGVLGSKQVDECTIIGPSMAKARMVVSGIDIYGTRATQRFQISIENILLTDFEKKILDLKKYGA